MSLIRRNGENILDLFISLRLFCRKPLSAVTLQKPRDCNALIRVAFHCIVGFLFNGRTVRDFKRRLIKMASLFGMRTRSTFWRACVTRATSSLNLKKNIIKKFCLLASDISKKHVVATKHIP